MVTVFAVAMLGSVALGANGRSARSGKTVIKTLQVTTAATPVDVDGDGRASIGDQIVFETVHMDPQTNAKIGYGDAVCTQINTADPPTYDCQGSDHVKGAEIREAGSGSSTTDARWGVLGGNGRYRNVSGEYRAHFLDANLTRARVTFTLSHVSR
jgi:hypothetical protein